MRHFIQHVRRLTLTGGIGPRMQQTPSSHCFEHYRGETIEEAIRMS